MDILKGNIAVGIGAAVAATVLAPVLIPVVTSVGRPLAKSLIRAGMLFYEKSREAVAVTGEALEDLIAEIHAEQAIRHPAAAGPAGAPERGEAEASAATAAPGANGAGGERPVAHVDDAGAVP
jgi:hypothetical protein